MNPPVSVRNFKPNSLALVSPLDATAGTVFALQIEHGHGRDATVTVIPAPGTSRFALSSTARVLMVTVPACAGVHVCVHRLCPGAHPDTGCHVAPPSTETSMPATRPPPKSAALPVIVAGCWRPNALVGGSMVDAGEAASPDIIAGTSPGWIDAGCTPMSANRFTVACCILMSTGGFG